MAEAGELVEQDQDLQKLGPAIRQAAGVQVHELLEEEAVERGAARDIVGGDAEVDGGRAGSQASQVNVRGRGRGVDQGVQPERHARRDGLFDGGEGVLAGRGEVEEGGDAVGRQGAIGGGARLDEGRQAPAGIAAGELAEDLAQGEGQVGRLGHIGADADEAGPRRLVPEGVGVLRRREEHGRDLLEFVQGLDRIAPVDVAERIIARGAPLGIERVEAPDRLAAAGAVAGGGDPVLLFDVQHHDRARPGQEVGNDHADALASPGRGVEEDVLGTVEDQGTAFRLADDDAGSHPQPGTGDLRAIGPARGAVERAAA